MAERADTALADVAAAVSDATHLLIAAGAGFSADSGLPVYADVASNPTWQALGLGYSDLCETQMLVGGSPEAGYGFWSDCARTYRETLPHNGYAILEAWAASKPPGNTAVYTSNVDGHFRRYPTLSKRLCEIHGCVEEWMCGASMGYAESTGAARSGAFDEHNRGVAQRLREQAVPWESACATRVLTPTAAQMQELSRVCHAALPPSSSSAGAGGLTAPRRVRSRACASAPWACARRRPARRGGGR